MDGPTDSGVTLLETDPSTSPGIKAAIPACSGRWGWSGNTTDASIPGRQSAWLCRPATRSGRVGGWVRLPSVVGSVRVVIPGEDLRDVCEDVDGGCLDSVQLEMTRG